MTDRRTIDDVIYRSTNPNSNSQVRLNQQIPVRQNNSDGYGD
jgi:hypothetical protein